MSSKHRPVTIVSGFLGSGKTTLLNRVLQEKHGHKFSVIVNEFGEIGLDAGLIKGQTNFVKMENGCLCCALNEDLFKTIDQLRKRDDFEAIILETTGIADPLPVAWTFLRPQLENAYRLSGLITVVDVLHYQTMLTQAREAKEQIEKADILYFSKMDIVSPRPYQECYQKMSLLNPHARIVLASDSDWLDLLFEVNDSHISQTKPQPSSHHSESFQTFSVDLNNQLIPLSKIEDLFENLPQEVFRAKAVFQKKGSNKIIVMHAVCGRVEFYESENYSGNYGAVFIGKGINNPKIKDPIIKSFNEL